MAHIPVCAKYSAKNIITEILSARNNVDVNMEEP
jgi:hypothetical protein